MRRFRSGVVLPLSLALLLVGGGVAYAAASTSIGAIVKDPVAFVGKLVSFSGRVSAVDGNEFTVGDGTTSVRVEGGPAWFKKLDVKTGDQLTVTGEVDEEGRPGAKTGKYQVDAASVAGPRGTTEVRKPGGPPPWAGGPKRVGPSHPGYGRADGADDDEGAPDPDDGSDTDRGKGPPAGRGKP
jgi:uncharacterized protein YdeI (BOF family)